MGSWKGEDGSTNLEFDQVEFRVQELRSTTSLSDDRKRPLLEGESTLRRAKTDKAPGPTDPSWEPNLASVVEWANELAQIGEVRKSVTLVYRSLSAALRSGQFQTIDRLLRSMEPSDFEPHVLLTALTATLPATKRLLSRRLFALRSQQYLCHSLGREYAIKSLRGLI